MTLKHKIRNYFKKATVKVIRARQQRAAHELARHLIMDNRDFYGMSQDSLAKAIMSKKTVFLDKVNGM